jgi:hypothetical protein
MPIAWFHPIAVKDLAGILLKQVCRACPYWRPVVRARMIFLKRGERVAFRPRIVAANEYPFAEGLIRNDPVLADLAGRMRRMRKASHAGGGIAPRAGRTTQNAPRTVGMNYVRWLARGLVADEYEVDRDCLNGSAEQGYLRARLRGGR